LADGTFWGAAYGSNEILRFSVNGAVLDRKRGPAAGFDRPFDLIRLADGRMLVTEVGADRVSILKADGSYVGSFGKKGRGNGELIGPQFAAVDGSGNVYVTDYGNARVTVFDPDGGPLFTFGAKSDAFPGFTAPAGIAILDERVFVADSVTGALHVFDTSGNYLSTLLPPGSIVQGESIRVWNGYLLVAALNRVALVDPETGASIDVARLGNAPIRITGAVPDANGNLILTDYKGNIVQIVSRMSEMVGGMFVQIDRVYADAFPKVTLEVRVEDRNRHPIVGLEKANFYVTEEKRAVGDLALVGSAWREEAADITILIDRSPAANRSLDAIRATVASIASAMNGKGTLRIVSAGAVPVQEGAGAPDTGAWEALRLKAPASSAWKFDLGLRLAVNDLVNASHKRAVVYVSTGEVSDGGFGRYGLNDLAAYLNNNGVIFSAVYLNPGAAPGEYAYLTASTGGKSYYAFRNEGLAAVVADIVSAPNGTYTLSYTSVLPTDFGRKFLPVEVETYLMNRSGRDETGYFVPLQ
jgi:DNA-binding beta-propeller fold protein YncE